MARGVLGGSLADRFAREREREEAARAPLPSFREFLLSPEWAAPYMQGIVPSPIIGAIADASEGVPVTTIDDTMSLEVFQLRRSELLGKRPRVVVVGAGRQAGKTSNLLAPKCVHAAICVPAPNVRPGQRARAVIISPKTDQAEAAFNYCKGITSSSPRIRPMIVKSNDEEIVLRRPDGKLVEIVVGAADRGGNAARSRSLVFAGLDEASFFFAQDGHTVNDRDIYEAALGTIRFIDEAQIWIVSTPWIEGDGLMEEFIAAHWGKPGGVLVAARVSSYALRGIADDGSLREETDTEDTYRREVLAVPLPRGSSGFFSSVELAAALDRDPPDEPPEELGAGGDFAFERDAAAVAVMARFLGGIFAPLMVEERHATPGDLEAMTKTVHDLGEAVATEGVNIIMADHWMRTFVREHLHLEGVGFVDAPGGEEGKLKTFGALKRVIEEGRFALGAIPRRMAEYVRDQLRSVVATRLPGGTVKITIPRVKRTFEGAGAGRVGAHGDVVSAIVLAAWQAGSSRTAASWEKPKVPAVARVEARVERIVAPRRPGAGGSADYLRRRSASVGWRPGGGGRGPGDD